MGVKSMTQAMLNGPSSSQPGIWGMTTMKSYLFAQTYVDKSTNEQFIYAQVVYPEVTVSRHQHSVCYAMLKNKLPDIKDIQDIMRKDSEKNVFAKMVKEVSARGGRPDPVTVPLTMHGVANVDAAWEKLRPLFCVHISASSVTKSNDIDDQSTWVYAGLKRRDRQAADGQECQWYPPETGPKGKTKSGSDRSTSTTTPDPTSVSQPTG